MKYHASQQDPAVGLYSYSSTWDATMIYGCACDSGWTGYKCSERVCPSGDDPLTGSQAAEEQLIRCDLDPSGGETFRLVFRQQYTSTLGADATASAVETALEALSTVESVTVTYDSASGSTTTFCDNSAATSDNIVTITFHIPHGDVPPLRIVDANGDAFTGATAAALSIATDGDSLTRSGDGATRTSVTGTTEDDECSGRGLCTTSTGVCTCFDGFASSDGVGNSGTRGDCGYNSDPVSACPGESIECTGHGTCSGNPDYKCTCDAGWTGGDCSLRTCPTGTAWFDAPTADNTAHADAECSNRGSCSRTTGQCTCESKFTGLACERMVCPGSNPDTGETCSGHGSCYSMAGLAQEATDNGESTPYTYGTVPGAASTWDAESVYGCFCDSGWEGFDCSLRSCPEGDDITTTDQTDEIQTLDCTYIANSPTFKLQFRDAQTAAIDYTADESAVQTALEDLDTIGSISVTFSTGSTQACEVGTTTITFTFQTEHGDVPPIRVVEEDGYTDAVDLSFGGMATTEDTKGTTESAVCNERGLCNHDTGNCECFVGFGSSNGQGGAGDLADCGYREPYVPVDNSAGTVWARVNRFGSY